MRNIIAKIKSNYETEQDKLNESIRKLTFDFLNLGRTIGSDSVTIARNRSFYLSNKNKFQSLKGQVLRRKDIQNATQKQMDSYLVEIYKKYSIPFACIVFVLVGAPIGIRIKKGGFGVAAGISLGFFLLYWASLIGGEKLADREIITPFAGMWSANFMLGFIGLFLVFKEIIILKTGKVRKLGFKKD